MIPSQRHLLSNILKHGIKPLKCSSCSRISVVLPVDGHSKRLGHPNFCPGRKFGTSLFRLNVEAVKNPLQTEAVDKPVLAGKEKEDSSSSPDKGEIVDWQLTAETEKYELGKRWLATMMGEDVETFTDEKIAEAVEYLLPSHLFAKDARPLMKDPIKLFGKKKETQIDPDGRPLHAAFYTGQPAFHELIFKIWENLEKLDNMKQETQKFEGAEEPSFYYDKPLLVRWLKQHELEEKLNCKLTQDQYELLIKRLTRIVNHPNGEEMQDFLSDYQAELSQGGKRIEVAEIDEDGYVTVMGYRKTAIAEVKLKEGSGKIMINDMPMIKFFSKFEHRQQVLYPLMVIDQLGRFDVDVGVIGGGETGKAGAIRLGVSRALLSFSQSFYQPLEEAGLLMRDSRQVERKKPGRKKARRKFAWVKR